MSGIRAGRAFVEIGASDKYSRALGEAQSRFNAFGNGIQSIGKKIGATGLAMAAPFAASIMQFARFDDSMRAVGAVTRASQEDLQSMTAVASELGRTTSFTAVEVATLMTELGRAGFSPKQINEMTSAVMDLARATGTDAALSAGIMAASLRQFGLGATEATRVADVLTYAANATFNTVEGLGESLKYAGPVAKTLGMNLEDTVAILGALGNVGIQGSDAGTALRRLSVIAAATGDDLRRIFGIENVDPAGKLKPLIQIMDEIGKAVSGLPVEQQVAKMEEAFGLMGITSASVLGNASTDVVALAKELQGATGTAAKTAAAMDAGLGGSFRIFLSAVEGVANAVGKTIEGPVMGIANAFSRVLGSVTSWIEANKTAVTAAALLAAGMVAAGAAMIVVGAGAKMAGMAIGGFSVAMVAAQAITKAMYVATLLLGGAMAATTGTTASLRTAVMAFNASSALMPKTTLATVGAMKLMGGGLGGVITKLAAYGGAWKLVLIPLAPFIIKALLIVAAIAAVAAILGVAANRAGIFAKYWETAKATMASLLGVAKDTFAGIAAAVTNGNYAQAFAIAWAGIKAAFLTALEGMLIQFQTFKANFIGDAIAFGQSLISTLWDIFSSIPSLLMSALTSGKSLASILADALSGGLGSVVDTVGNYADASRKKLAEMRAEQEQVTKSAKILADQQAELNSLQNLKDEATKKPEAEKAPEDPTQGMSVVDKAAHVENQAKIAQLKAELAQRDAQEVKAIEDRIKSLTATAEKLKANQGATTDQSGNADQTKTEIADLQAKLAARQPSQSDRLKEDSISGGGKTLQDENITAIEERTAALQKEAKETSLGTDAAKRLAFAEAGVGDARLKAYDAAITAKAAADMQADMTARLTALADERLALEQGAEVAERFKLSQLGATAAQLDALKAAQIATKQASDNADDKRDGESLRESLRTPLQVLNDELAEVFRLKNAGAIDGTTKDRAVTKSRDAFMDTADTEEKRKAFFDEERQRLAGLVSNGQLNLDAANRQLAMFAGFLAEAANRAAGAGDALTKLTTTGTSDGFAVGRLAPAKDDFQKRTAVAAEENVKATGRVEKAVGKQRGQKFKGN